MKLSSNPSLFVFTLIASALAFSAQAHEIRYIGNGYVIQVGDDVEPPIANQTNGVDFIAGYETTPGDISTITPVDRTAGDVVEVVALPLKLQYETFNSPITQVFPLLTTFQDTTVDGFPGLVSNFTFPSIGTYGYIVAGKIKKQGHSDKFFVEKFVCGAGSQDTTYGSSFECVAQ